MLLYVIRHGETDANKEGRFQGWSDNPLNEKGIELAAVTGRAMKGIHFDGCFSSPLIRAQQTAQIVLRESENADIPILIDDRIKEIGMGEWEGKRFRTDLRDAEAEAAKQFFHRPFEFPGFPGGENARQVCERTQQFLWELAAKDDKRTYLISIHGFAMRAMLNCLYEDPSDFWQQHVPLNCEVNILEAEDGRIRFSEQDKVYYDAADCVDRYKEMQE